jgi:hypothetical protein
LLEVINPVGSFDAVQLYSGPAPVGTQSLALLQYPESSGVLEQQTTQVVGARQDISGIEYFQLQGLVTPGAQGAPVVDNAGLLRALRMNDAHMLGIGIARAGETWSIDGSALTLVVLPRLRTGISVINPPPDSCSSLDGPPPALPAIFSGDLTQGGVAVPVGTRVFVRVKSFGGGTELWFFEDTTREGRYLIPVSICEDGFQNGIVDFWLDGSQAGQTTTYAVSEFRTTDLVLP